MKHLVLALVSIIMRPNLALLLLSVVVSFSVGVAGCFFTVHHFISIYSLFGISLEYTAFTSSFEDRLYLYVMRLAMRFAAPSRQTLFIPTKLYGIEKNMRTLRSDIVFRRFTLTRCVYKRIFLLNIFIVANSQNSQ